MKFLLVRHCETDWNKEWRLQGHTDTNLNEYGWLQAEDLAKKLVGNGLKKIISSDLMRSIETASVIERYLKIPVAYDSRLRECNFGSLEGKKRDEVLTIYRPKTIDIEGNWHGSFLDYDFESFGGESSDKVFRRHLSLLDELNANISSEPTLLVGHGTGLNTLLFRLKKQRIERGECVEIEYP